MMNKNDYLIKINNHNGFLNPSDGKIVRSRYDEPTYLTFRVNFFIDKVSETAGMLFNDDKNAASYVMDYINKKNNKDNSLTYNILPEALFDIDTNYSTYNYLKNNLGDEYRAKLMKEFLKLVNDLNDNFPYYIKSIEGLDELLKVSPSRGSRIKKGTTITLKCYESLDQRISTLKTLYKKIAWDDEYQRWILPDIMRYFSMDIYISEFRIFHENKHKSDYDTITGKLNNNESKLATVKTIKNILGEVKDVFSLSKNFSSDSFLLTQDTINNVIPTTKIRCKMCEFDIDSMYSIYSSLSKSSPKDKSVDDVEIKIKVGNISETIYNAAFLSKIYIDDEKINQKKIYKDEDAFYKNIIKPFEDIIYSERTGIFTEINDNAAVNFNDDSKSFVEGYIGKALKEAVKGAVAYGDNWVNDKMNHYYSKKIGDSNLSLNDMMSAIASGNINTMYNTFKNKADAIKELYPEISQATNQSIEVKAFKSFIEELAKNEENKPQSLVAKTLLEYGDNINANSIDDYMEIINIVNSDIQKEINEKLIMPEIEMPQEISQATNQKMKQAKLVL